MKESEITRNKKSEMMKRRWQTGFRDVVIRKQKEGHHPWRTFGDWIVKKHS